MAQHHSKNKIWLVASMALIATLMMGNARFVDRRRELQDVNMEEEVGALGHE